MANVGVENLENKKHFCFVFIYEIPRAKYGIITIF